VKWNWKEEIKEIERERGGGFGFEGGYFVSPICFQAHIFSGPCWIIFDLGHIYLFLKKK
jgi:hypothetical protein